MMLDRFLRNRKNISILMIITLASAITTLYLIQIEWQKKTENIKVMTWNIHNGVGIDDQYDIDRISSVIKTQNPDIIGLQEVEEDMAAYIADELDMEYIFGADYDDDEGNAILSKYPIEDVQNLYLSPDNARSLIRAEIIIDSEKWYFFITHLSLRPTEDNLRQTKQILSKVLKGYSRRVVLIGDFNFGPDSEQYDKILHHETIRLIDTYRHLNEDSGLTFRTDYLFRRIDYIFCSSDLKPTISEVVHSFSSDHCALLTTF
jgi:endonuclease/exonuclease/phosphatase family metal-dependent hydrolase